MSNKLTIDRRLITILLVVFVQIVGASMVFPILPLYARNSFSVPDEVVTLLVSSFFAAQFIGAPILGRLSDRYGRVPVLIVSQIGTAISFLMLAAAGSIEVLFLSRLLDGITGGNITVAQAYVTDITPKENRTEALGLIFAAFGVGFIVGPATGGILASLFGSRIPFVFASVAASLIVLMTWRFLDESLTDEQKAENKQSTTRDLTPRAVVSNFPLMLILIFAFVNQLAFGLLQATFALYGEDVLFTDLDSQDVSLGIGLLLAGIGLGQVITQTGILPRLTKRFKDSSLITVGASIRGVTLLVYAVISSPFIAAANGLFFALGTGIAAPTSQSLTTKTVDDKVRGGVLGLYQSSRSLATIVGTAFSGALYTISPQTPYFVGAGLFVVAVAIGMYFMQWSNNNPNIGDESKSERATAET